MGIGLCVFWLETGGQACAESHGLEGEQPKGELRPRGSTVLGIQGRRFVLNGEPTFLLGTSYYGGLGAPEEFVRRAGGIPPGAEKDSKTSPITLDVSESVE